MRQEWCTILQSQRRATKYISARYLVNLAQFITGTLLTSSIFRTLSPPNPEAKSIEWEYQKSASLVVRYLVDSKSNYRSTQDVIRLPVFDQTSRKATYLAE
jgi:hypothetical protein